MNPKVKNTILTSISVLALVLSITSIYASTTADEVLAEQQCLKQQVESFTIPQSVDFADEKVVLSRYDLRERYEREISSIAFQHSFTLLSIKRANRYFPLIEPILKRNGIPDDFKYLALIESNFNIRAVSPVKAAGFWQFMPETARELGLEVSEEVDERYHIEKSTEAACAYLKRAYAKFGDWIIVAASYNAGMGRLSEELKKQEATEFYDLWLNDETSRYVFRLIAMKSFLLEPKRYGYQIKKDHFYPTVRTTELTITNTIPDLAAFAKANGVPYVLFKEYNTWLRNRKLEVKEGKSYKILIPMQEDLEYDVKKVRLHQNNWAVE